MVDFCSEKREKREMFAKKMGSQLTAVVNPLNILDCLFFHR